MQLHKQQIFNDMTLPVGRYGRVINILQSGYSDEWIEVGDIVFQAKSYGPWPDNYQIFNTTKGITGYTNPSHWRQGRIAQQPFIEIEILCK